ncbi:RICIN domain-containing protein [Pseudohaliea sp.]|uniref:RICIN domain-containing protein n=1 Tax=Pseudohaliea sp. TaxID=2740289 RepID=UPI0032F00202
MNPTYRIAAGLLAALLAGGAAAQFNTDAMKKMQKEGLERLDEQKAAETAKPAGAGKAAAARRAYRFGNNLCLDARGALSVEPCNGKAASQQWALGADRHLVASDGRCLAGASLVKCGQGKFQQWTYDKRGRLRNDAGQCLQPGSAKAGAPVSAAACSDAPAQVWQ